MKKLGKIIFFTGGARSGKSKFAEEYIKEKNYKNKIYFATSIPFDDEMKERVKKHRDRRNETWHTIEGYKNLTTLLEKNFYEKYNVILFDCITNFVSNFMLNGGSDLVDIDTEWDIMEQDVVINLEQAVLDEMDKFLKYIRNKNIDCIFVTNEIGMGLIPSYALGRYFRDICGNVNQMVAKESDEAYLIVSGIKVKIK